VGTGGKKSQEKAAGAEFAGKLLIGKEKRPPMLHLSSIVCVE
jgi:hypothetical protein